MARTERRAFGHNPRGAFRRHPRLAARACGAEQLDASRDRPDRRNVDMIVLLREFLSGFAEHGAARTVLGVEASRRVGLLGQLARDAGPALAPPLDRRRLGVRLLPRAKAAARNCPAFSAVRPRLASNSAMAGVQRLHLRQQLVDALIPGGDLRQEPVDPRQQRRHQMGVHHCSENRSFSAACRA